ncbi:MAG TPA: hypothetical protein VF755_02780 [Catenuloplanes sp.]|jgi:hypothetical protein
MRSTPLCESPRCATDPDTGDLAPRAAAPGLRLCWPCRDWLAAHLDELPAWYAELETMLTPAAAAAGEKVSGSTSPGLPINPVTVAARDDIATILISWADLVIDKRGGTPPPRTVDAVAGYLRGCVDWLAAYPAAGDTCDEVAELVHTARRAAYPNPARRITVGECATGECPGTMTAVLRDPDNPRPSAIYCDTEPAHEWPVAQWITLRRRRRTRRRIAA